MIRRTLVIGTLVLLGTFTATAQDASERTTNDLSATGGELRMIVKKSGSLSGSLGLSQSQSASGLSGVGGNRYNGTLGGTLVKDRVWFFASAEHDDRIGPVVGQTYGANATGNAVDAKVIANLGDRQNLAAIYSQGQQSVPTAGVPQFNTLTPSSFFSMRYTGIVTNNMFFTANVSQRTVSQNDPFLAPAGQ